MQLIHGYVTLVAPCGCTTTLPSNCAGIRTGYGRVDNPYWDGDEYWRFKDGDTVIECNASHPRALPVAEAYAQLHEDFLAEQADWDAIDELYAQQDRDYWAGMEELEAERAWENNEGHLYNIQDQLNGLPHFVAA